MEQVKLKNGQTIEMRLSDEWDEITFYENGDKLDGEFEFSDVYDNQSAYLLKRAYSPKNLIRCGIGEAAIRFHKSVTGNAPIFTREIHITHHDVDDGSQLTGDAIKFVMAMQKKKLICNWETD